MAEILFAIDAQHIAQVQLPSSLAASTMPLMGPELLQQLEVICDKIQAQRAELTGVVLSLANCHKEREEREVLTLTNENQWQLLSLQGQELLAKWATLGVPTVACLSGGWSGAALEFALCSRVLIAGETLQLYFSSVDFGLIPALGASYRLVEKVGIRPALDILLFRKKLAAQEAWQLGLVAEVVSTELLAKASTFFDYHDAYGLKKSLRNFWWDNFLNRKIIFQNAREQVLVTGRGLAQAPLKLLDIMEIGGEARGMHQMQLIAAGFAELAVSEQARHFLQVEQRINQIGKLFCSDADQSFFTHLRAGVVGIGQVGSSLAQLLAQMQFRPIIKDQNLANLQDQLPQLSSDLYSLSFREDFQGFRRLGLVFESTGDDFQSKIKVLAAIENAIADDCILATVTKVLSVQELAKTLQHPERFVGINFFPDVKTGRIIEIIYPPQTNNENISRLCAWALAAGKIPLVIADRPGFLVRKLLEPYLMEAQLLLAEGLSAGIVEQACLNFGLAQGPWQIMEEWNIWPAIGQSSPSGGRTEKELDEITIQMRLLLPVLKVAADLLEQQVVTSAAMIDIALIYGMGFPASRGGLLCYIDQEGIPLVVGAMRNFAQTVSQERFAPGVLLTTMEQEQRTFYGSF